MHAELGKEPQFVEQINRLGVGFNEALHPQSLVFLHDLWHKAVFPFDQWLTKFERSALQLRSHQLDTVIAMLHTEIALSEGIMDSLHDYLLASPDAESIIDALLPLHASELNESALEHHLMHHALPHALEIANRVNQVMDHFSLLTVNDPACRFLRAVVTLMVQFHDHEQKMEGEYHSVEEATAARVSGWITTALALSEHEPLKKLIDFMVGRIIVLGTTMIYSATRTMDLSELYFDVRDLATTAGYPVVHALLSERSSGAPESKAGLIHSMDAILLLAGVCDKNPASIYDVVVRQSGDEAISTLSMMNRYFQRPLLLEQFFESKAFFSPFDHGALPLASQQAFLMALIPHVSMRAELSGPCSHAFIDFILLCRRERLRLESHAAFIDAFHAQCITLDMNRTVGLFFFEAIESQINFCISQERGLVFVANKLMSMGFSPKSMTGIASGHFQPMITPRAPVRDAENLRALKIFYDQLDQDSQAMMISELLFAIVVQAGELQAGRLGLYAKKQLTLQVAVSDAMPMQTNTVRKKIEPPPLRRGGRQSNFFASVATNSEAYSADKIGSAASDASAEIVPSSGLS